MCFKIREGQRFRDEQGRQYKVITQGCLFQILDLNSQRREPLGLVRSQISVKFAERVGRMLFNVKDFRAVKG